MSLIKVSYLDRVTPITAKNLNEIQDAIIDLQSTSGVFWATYNATTETEIAEALAAGKAVMMKNSNEVFYLTKRDSIGPSGSAYVFVSLTSNAIKSTFVSGSYWNTISTLALGSFIVE